MSDAPDKLKPFTHFGLDLPGGTGTENAVGDCPFCGKERHFSVLRETGQYRCWVCPAKGNAMTFMRELHAASATRYGEQSEEFKGITARTLRTHGVVRSLLTGEWLLPVYSREGKIMNLARYANSMGRWLMAPKSSGAKSSLYLLNLMSKNATFPILLMEGITDTLAMDQTLRERQLRSKYDVLGQLGDQNFQDKWVTVFAGRPLWAFYDNDKAGRTAAEKMAEYVRAAPASKRPTEYKALEWPDWFPDGHDARDILTAGIPQPIEVPTIARPTAMRRVTV